MRRLIILAVVVAVTAALAAPALALPGKPDFNDHIFADGQAYGTKVVAMLPTPNGKNMQSFDKLFIITNGLEGQLPVAEAAPGNSDYNGGRWYTAVPGTRAERPHRRDNTSGRYLCGNRHVVAFDNGSAATLGRVVGTRTR